MRRLWVAVIGSVSMGEPVAPGGGVIRIFDKLIGRTVGEVAIPFGDDGILRTQLEEDFLPTTPEQFAERWF